jgi:hypothetical protein
VEPAQQMPIRTFIDDGDVNVHRLRSRDLDGGIQRSLQRAPAGQARAYVSRSRAIGCRCRGDVTLLVLQARRLPMLPGGGHVSSM